MAEEGIGFFSALFRFFTFYKWRKALGLIRAADAQFTGSAQGISDAFDLHHDKLVGQYNALEDSVAQIEVTLEGNRTSLDELNKEETQLIKQSEGALALGESEPDKIEFHRAAYDRFQKRIAEIEAEQAELAEEIANDSKTVDELLLQLSELDAEVQRLPAWKAKEISRFIASKAKIATRDRLRNLQTSIDRGPLDAVLKANRELTAKANVASKVMGTDARLQDKKYEQVGRQSVSNSAFDQLLAARKAEREAKTGVKTAPVTVAEAGDSRPRI